MHPFKKEANNKRGFTLIELMVVIAIIGILASIITVSLASSRAKGRDGKRVADIRTIQLAIEEYYNDNGYYPVTLTSLSPTYLSVLPKDPKDNSTPYVYSSFNLTTSYPTGNTNCFGKANNYHLAAIMEQDENSNPALKQDVDSTASNGWTACTGTGNSPAFSGKATNCSGTTDATYDSCYDVTN